MDNPLGKLINKDENAERDAVHIAIVPLRACESLWPGLPFRLAFDSSQLAYRCNNVEDAVGIVDPFLNHTNINIGDRFWGLLMPNSVTGMRHHWQHPAFNIPQRDITEHERWLREFCDKWNFSFDELVSAGVGQYKNWRYATAYGRDLHDAGELGEDLTLFWEHLEGYTGRKFSQEHRGGMGWSCSC